MADAESTIRLLVSGEARNVFILALSFEDRCMRIPRILSSLTPDRRRNRIVCASLPDDNVFPLARSRRKAIKEEIENLIGPEWKSANEVTDIAEAEAAKPSPPEHPLTNLVVDASGMPRELVFDILAAVAERRHDFESVYLTYNHPRSYSAQSLEMPSPAMPLLYRSPLPRGQSKLSLALFPGFNAAETALTLAQVMDWSQPDQAIRVWWLFVHAGTRYSFYERSLGQHAVFIECLKGMSHNVRICSMSDFTHIASAIIGLTQSLDNGEPLFLAGLGPRIISVPILLASRALREHSIPVNVFKPRPIYYESLRSRGEGPEAAAWDLNAEYMSVRRCIRTGT